MRALVIVFLSLVVSMRPAEACRCSGTLASGIKAADAVFWGEVTSVTTEKSGVRLTIAVYGVWKGDVKAKMLVVTDNTSCGLGAKAGSRFLFAAREKDGVLFARQCGGSRRATAAVRAEVTRLAGAARAPS